jgi:hypothetical protein
MADLIAVADGTRKTLADPSKPHQIRIDHVTGPAGGLYVSCNCSAAPLRSASDEVWDVWVLYNRLVHDQGRGLFRLVDELTGRPIPLPSN